MTQSERIANLREFIEDLINWSRAYPESVFHEPTPAQVDAACNSLGFSIDSISAMVLRRFTKRWGERATNIASLLDDMEREGEGEAGPEVGDVVAYVFAGGDYALEQDFSDDALNKWKTGPWKPVIIMRRAELERRISEATK